MVRVILSPGVTWASQPSRWRFRASAFVLASTASSGALGLALGFGGAHLPDRLRLALVAAAAAILLVIGCVEASGSRPWLPQRDRESPLQWLEGEPLWGIVKTGAWLGVAVTTRIGFALVVLVPLTAMLSGSLLLGTVTYGAYGLTRGLSGWMITRSAMTPRTERPASLNGSWLLALNPSALRVSGLATLLLASITLV
jgi:hypothetical protein